MKNEQKLQEELLQKIKESKERMNRCIHVFEDSKYDPEDIMVQDDRAGYEEHGVDRWPIMSFHKETKNRWSRECIHCGKKEYTYEQEVVEVKRTPKF